MKKLMISLIVLTALSCNLSDTKKSKMEQQAKIIEMVLWKSKKGISVEETKQEIKKLNDFIKKQPGFIARKTSVSNDDKFLDIVYWTDLKSAKTASQKAMKNEEIISVFNIFDEKEMIFQYFETFNSIN